MLARFTENLKSKVENFGAVLRFGFQALRLVATEGVPPRLLTEQLFECGVKAIPTTLVSGFFVGAIMAIQIELQLRNFGAEGAVGGVATSVTIRNVGPVLIGFILVGKVGALTTAVLGTMRVTDQIDALTCLGVDPIRMLVAPRLIAAIISCFLLLTIGLIVSVGGGSALAWLNFGTNPWHYISQIPKFVSLESLLTGGFKSLAFGTLLGSVACYQGYWATGGAAGVGKMVRKAAINSLVGIIVADFFISWIISHFLRGIGH
ncbi:MAG: ABC transporter permease [Deltaproteobacteria bacterium]|nr:ABC transporter permease [Deltaproteobacteria bacterium]MBI3295649.1 ABC transporter permease [Deltaproteobacteria bacterium]